VSTILFPSGSLAPGQHVSLMGADGPGKAEIAVGELARCRLFCDDWEQASHGGELAAAGRDPRQHVAELGHVLAAEHAGLHRVDEIAVVARLDPVVAEDADARQLADGDLRLPRPVGAHQARMLAWAERPHVEHDLAPGRHRHEQIRRERFLAARSD